MVTTTGTREARAVAYNRISRFRLTEGGDVVTVAPRGVDRQAEDADELADLRGLGTVRHITDNNQSASEYAAKARTGWPELLEAVRSGEYTHVLVWMLDRAVRQVGDIDDLLKACKAGGAIIVQTSSGTEVNPHDPMAKAMAFMAAVMASAEADKMSLRAKRRKADDAKAGRPHGGRRRFGYDDMVDGALTVRESEATEIRRMVRELLAGASLRGMADDLAARGITGPTGATITGPNLGLLLARPHLAGLRVHNGEVMPGVVGQWPAIISEADHRRVVALLNDPRRRTSPASNVRRHLLSGVALCDACGTKILTGPKGVYRCPTGRHVQKSMDLVDDVVVGAVLGLLRTSTAASLFADDTTAEELDALEVAKAAKAAELSEARALRRDGRLRLDEYADLTSAIRDEMDALDAHMAALVVDDNRDADMFADLLGAQADDAWATMDLARRRSVIARLVTVRLVGRGRGSRFTPSDVVITRRVA